MSVKSPTLRSRKPVVELTTTDFATYPVWEYALDEEKLPDETWVRPVVRTRLHRGLYSQLVSSRFRTAFGQELLGFMDVSTYGPQAEITPGALLEPEYLPLPTMSRAQALRRNAKWVLQDRRNILKALRRREATTFPIRYELQLPFGRGADLPAGLIR